nr:lysozyme [Amycolatopsis sp. GM8]
MTPTAAAAADYSLAGSTFAGSQIAKVEGGDPTMRYQSLDGIRGHDVSGHQGPVDWGAAWAAGGRFVYIKATEGTGYTNPQFAQQYNGSYDVGMIRGAYHFARPDVSSGAAQANYFVDHGGGWSPDGRTLPGALDAEYNPYGDACYGMDPVAMSVWLADFSNTYLARTGRFPAIYTSASWWNRCTGGNAGFGANPLWVARYNDFIGALPAGWQRQVIWQYADAGPLPGDQNLFDGSPDQLSGFALNR